MKVIIVSPERTLFSGEAQSVTLPGTKGQFEVLDHHAPIISSLRGGQVIVNAQQVKTFNIMGGFIDVANNEVTICVDA